MFNTSSNSFIQRHMYLRDSVNFVLPNDREPLKAMPLRRGWDETLYI